MDEWLRSSKNYNTKDDILKSPEVILTGGMPFAHLTLG